MKRCRLPELMDQPSLDERHRADALQALNRINRMLGIDQRRLNWARETAGTALTSVLDLGAGGGGFLGYLSKKNGSTLKCLLGLDRSSAALNQARCWQNREIRWIRGDALHIPLADNSIDLVTCSQFMHHFDAPQVVQILKESARIAGRGIVMTDLTRSRLALALTWIFTRLMSRSVVFHYDGPLSVRAAYTQQELKGLARQAGLSAAEVHRRFPFRMSLVWKKSRLRAMAE